MPNLHYNQIAGQKIGRIEALSDGVFAIALTLLVLEIKVPEVHVQSEAELWEILKELAPKFSSYFLSFMTMGIFWTGQALQLSHIEKYDRNLNWNSLFFLLFVSLLPFTTAFLGEYTHFKTAIGIYWVNIFLLGLLLLLHWKYAVRKGFVNLEGNELETVGKAVTNRIIIAQALYLFGALLCFINPYLSIGFIILVQLNYAFAIVKAKMK
ncbi:MAG: TMEM175 family protein [Flavobacterium sp.]